MYTDLTAVGKAWQKDYMAKTNGDTSTGPTADYDAMLLLAAAIEKAGTVDPDAVNSALPTVTVEGTTGKTRYGGADVLGIPHLLERPINVVEVQKRQDRVRLQRLADPDHGDHVAVAVSVTGVGRNAGEYLARRSAERRRDRAAGRRDGRRSAGPHRERAWQHK